MEDKNYCHSIRCAGTVHRVVVGGGPLELPQDICGPWYINGSCCPSLCALIFRERQEGKEGRSDGELLVALGAEVGLRTWRGSQTLCWSPWPSFPQRPSPQVNSAPDETTAAL